MTLGKSAGGAVVAATIACALALGGCTTGTAIVDSQDAASVRATTSDLVQLTPHQTVPVADALSTVDAPAAPSDPVSPDPVSPDPVAPSDADQDLLLSVANPLPVDAEEALFGGATEPGGGLTAPWGPQTPAEKQLFYMLAHWNNYNVAVYGDFNPSGGDCMNFVSQSLVERGWAMQPDWYNFVDPSNGYRAVRPEFIHVPSFDNWLMRHPGFATRLEFSQKAQVKVGDVVVFDWDNDNSLDHAMAVSEIRIVNGVRKIFLIGHNNDVSHRDFDGVISGTGATGHFWSIP